MLMRGKHKVKMHDQDLSSCGELLFYSKWHPVYFKYTLRVRGTVMALHPGAEEHTSPRRCKEGWSLLTASSALQKGPKKEGKKAGKSLCLDV